MKTAEMLTECNFDYASVVFLKQAAKNSAFDPFDSSKKQS